MAQWGVELGRQNAWGRQSECAAFFGQKRSGNRLGGLNDEASGGAASLPQQAFHPDQISDLAVGKKHQKSVGQRWRRRVDPWAVGGWDEALGKSSTQILDEIGLPKACEKNHKFTCLAFCA